MIQLLTFPPAFGLFSSSPFCVKAAYLLNMSGLPWEPEETTDPRKMPFGKLPVIRTDDGKLIADTAQIRAHLEGLGHDFDAGLSPKERAQAHAITRMVEEHLYFHLLLDRWGNPEVWPQVRDVFFSGMPPGLRQVLAWAVRRQILKSVDMQGIGRLGTDQRLQRAAADLDSIRVQLRDGPFLFGATPCSADASVAPMLAAVMATPAETALKRLVSQDGVLPAYVERVAASCG